MFIALINKVPSIEGIVKILLPNMINTKQNIFG